MIEMHSKYDNTHENGMFYALICIIIMFLHFKIACYQQAQRKATVKTILLGIKSVSLDYSLVIERSREERSIGEENFIDNN